ncbi:MAG: response regulator transcription factor [Deltaproteobacteria bacterium]|nr:response regulator transcription factor [Deltaproteobacteria bacterium]
MMENIKAVIAEDEKTLREHFRAKLSVVWPNLIICGEAWDGITALTLIKEYQPDIVFLDIKMPGLSGIDVAKKIAGKCLIVFITAYNRYAVDAFERGAIDYILKPVTDERMQKTVKRLQDRIAQSSAPSSISEILEKAAGAFNKQTKYLEWIRVLHKGSIRIININEIYYFKSADRYTVVRTGNGEFLIRKAIKELEEELPPDKFWRIHRGAIVNVSHISKLTKSFTDRYEVNLRDLQETLIVSRAYSHLFRQM